MFADPVAGDFSLRADSPALKAGFNPFDWKIAGPLPTERPNLAGGDGFQTFTQCSVMGWAVVAFAEGRAGQPDALDKVGDGWRGRRGEA